MIILCFNSSLFVIFYSYSCNKIGVVVLEERSCILTDVPPLFSRSHDHFKALSFMVKLYSVCLRFFSLPQMPPSHPYWVLGTWLCSSHSDLLLIEQGQLRLSQGHLLARAASLGEEAVVLVDCVSRSGWTAVGLRVGLGLWFYLLLGAIGSSVCFS